MHRSPARPLRAAALLTGFLLLGSGCSVLDGVSGRDTGLKKALHRVADTKSTRAYVEYGDLGAVGRLAGSEPPADSPWSGIAGMGAAGLAPYAKVLPDLTGIRLNDADYAVLAGQPPAAVGLIVGGQDTDGVTESLRRNGWERTDGGLRRATSNPSSGDGTAGAAAIGLALHQVDAADSDVAYGQQKAPLDTVGDPDGATLGDNERFDALAGCLGDVLAATIVEGGVVGPAAPAEGAAPEAVAVGVLTTDDSDSTPRTVVCATWDSAAEAKEAAGKQRQAVTSGTSARNGSPYSTLFTDSETTEDDRTVRLEANTRNAAIGFQALQSRDLPGLSAPPRKR